MSIGQKFDAFLAKHTHISRVHTFYQNFVMLTLNRVDFLPMGRFTGLAMRDTFGMTDQVIDLPQPILVGNLYISMSKKSNYIHVLPMVEKQIKKEGYYHWVEELLKKYTKIYADDHKINTHQ